MILYPIMLCRCCKVVGTAFNRQIRVQNSRKPIDRHIIRSGDKIKNDFWFKSPRNGRHLE